MTDQQWDEFLEDMELFAPQAEVYLYADRIRIYDNPLFVHERAQLTDSGWTWTGTAWEHLLDPEDIETLKETL